MSHLLSLISARRLWHRPLVTGILGTKTETENFSVVHKYINVFFTKGVLNKAILWKGNDVCSFFL